MPAVRRYGPERRVIEIAAQPVGEEMMENLRQRSGSGLSDLVMEPLYTLFLSTKGVAGLASASQSADGSWRTMPTLSQRPTATLWAHGSPSHFLAWMRGETPHGA